VKANLNPRRVFAAPAILTACFILQVVAVEPAHADQGVSVGPGMAILGSGTTGAEIQRALDSLPAAGGEVVLPAGDFAISRPVVLRRSHQILRGAGSATVLRLADNANCPVIIMGEPVNQPRRTITNLLVSDLFIDGNRLHQRQELWQLTPEGSEIHNNGITVQGVSDSLVKNVTCARCRSGGLVTTLGVRRLTVENFEAFDNEFDGLACYSTTDCRFVNLNLHDNPDAGISLDLAFDHNCIANAVLTANGLGIFMRASRDNRFQNISIRHSHQFGVFIAQTEVATPLGCRPLAHSECTDNLFTDLKGINCGGPVFHVNDSSCTNNVVVADAKMAAAFYGKLSPATYAAF
jgi:hypothetical protein